MAGGLVGLLDDVAALAKLAAASVDDVGAAAGKASAKAAGVVVDDTAVTPAYVQGIAADRELPIIKKIAIGSLRNKLLIILPIALLLGWKAPVLVEVILMLGGTYLCFEGVEKIYHKLQGDHHADDVPATLQGPDAEKATIDGAIRTDLILSAEIMVIALKDVIDEPFVSKAIIMVIVAIFITIVVYGVVALIVKMDDVGLALASRDSEASQKLGRRMVSAMPVVLKWLTIIGTAAMLWVGGHIILVGTHELGWDGLYDIVHDVEHSVHDIGALSGVAGWLINTGLSAVIGIIVGSVAVGIFQLFKGRSNNTSEANDPH